MAIAHSKSELMKVTAKEWDRIYLLLKDFPEELAVLPDEEGFSVKDVVMHRAHWISLFLRCYHDGWQTIDVLFPKKNYRRSELKRYSLALRQREKDVSWTEALARLDTAHEEFVSLIETLSDAQLYGAPMEGAHNSWSTGRWAEAAGASHLRLASKYVLKRLRDMKQ